MKGSVTERLGRETLLLDGGMGSALIARGLVAGGSPDLWNLERPDVVREIHDAYFAAGSHVVQTNTFGANALVLRNHNLEHRMEEINRAGALIAREAAGPTGPDRGVAGNLGPSGRFLRPVGKAEPEELEDAFAAQAAALAAGGVDYLSIETMSHADEALCALRGALRATDLPVTVCLAWEKKKRGFFTLMGDRVEDVLPRLADAGATAAGANCSLASDVMRELLPLLLDASPVPVVVKPNAGLPAVEGGRPVYRQRPADFARDVAALARLGAAAVGGCCGTDATFIAALRDELAGGPEEIDGR